MTKTGQISYTVYLKVTNGCNLQCKHCYNEQEGNHLRMSEDVLSRSVHYIKNFAQMHASDTVIVKLHGGEPMLYRTERLLSAVVELSAVPNVTFSVTTNLAYPITDMHLAVFRYMEKVNGKPFVQTSWDYKIRFDTPGQERLWESNVRYLLSLGFDVQPTITLTNLVLREMEPRHLFDYVSSLGCASLNFERYTENGRGLLYDFRAPNREVDRWLFNAFLIYYKELYGRFTVPLFDGVIDSMHGVLTSCRERKCCATTTSINPDGNLGTCPNIAHLSVGNLHGENGQKRIMLIRKEAVPNSSCLLCKFYVYCHGECSQLRYDESGCPGMRMIYNYLTAK